MADFKLVNLAEDGTSVSEAVAYDIVFCRNVLMYFTPDQARMLVGRIARALAPGGYLFLGHAETLRGLTQDFHLCQAHGAFYYVRKGPCRQPCTGASSVVRELGASSAGLDEMARAARSWVDVIGRASDRIQVLAEKRKPDDHALNGGDAAGGARGLVGAMELLQRERYQDALACVATLPRESARDPEVLLLRAVLQTHGGNLPEAEAICRLLLEIDELNSGAHYVMALCKEALGDGKGAAEHDRIAVHLDPGFAMPRLHLGLLARRNGERTSARRELERALALLEREDPSRLLLFGGGFGRAALVALCRAELTASGGAP
jgi:chemotaxis protein methyltransferase CheR